jgi:hypothetical protein
MLQVSEILTFILHEKSYAKTILVFLMFGHLFQNFKVGVSERIEIEVINAIRSFIKVYNKRENEY